MPPIATLAGAVAATVSLVAAHSDLRTGRIPNSLTIPLLLIAPPVLGFCLGPGAAAEALIGGVVCAAVPMLLFQLGAMGGGDVKLLALMGALLGPTLGLEIQWLAYCAAGLQGVGLLTLRHKVAPPVPHWLAPAPGRPPVAGLSSTSAMPMGPAISAATLGVVLLRSGGWL